MSRRPGSTSRLSGCFLIAFFGVFAGMAIFFLSAILIGENVSGDIWIGALISAVFLIVGLGGVYAGVRVLLGKPVLSKASRQPGADPNAPYGAETVPKMKVCTPQPNGYYRLPPETSHKAQFWIWTGVAIFWNGITWTVALNPDDSGDKAPLWFLLLFQLVGIGLVYAAIKGFLRWMMVGETHVDVNAAAVSPGQVMEILVSQPGKFKIEQVKVDFICQEKASYRAGTDRRTKTKLVKEVPICDLPEMTAREGKVLAHQSAQVPQDAMPSFEAPNNKINWLIRVKMVLPGRPDVEQCYPLLVMSPGMMETQTGAVRVG